MKITDLIIDPKSLGDKLWLVDISPSYEYKNDHRTDAITGFRYTVAMPDKNLEKISVKIDGKQLIEKPDEYAEVTFSGLEVYIYWHNGQPQVGAKATGVALANHKS